jgi:surface polysaccharide O-acyltransferase-like enzyme
LYLAFRDASRAFVTHEPLVPQSPMMLLSGGQTHLWFLPFVLLVTFAGFLIVRPVLKSPGLSELTAMTCLLVGAMFAFAPLPAMQPEVDTVNFARVAWYSLPAAFWGIGLALSDDLFESLKRHPHAVTFAAASVTVLFVGFAVSVGLTVWSKNIAGIAWLIAALCAPPAQWHRRLASLAPLGFGLYLTHPFILGVINAMAKAVHLRDSAILDLVGFVLAIIGGLALAWMLRLSRWTRWLVP